MTTHDAILLIVALLYVAVGFGRAILDSGRQVRRPPGWFFVPFWIAAALAIVAVLW